MKLKKKVMAVVLAAAMTASLMVPAFGSTQETTAFAHSMLLRKGGYFPI